MDEESQEVESDKRIIGFSEKKDEKNKDEGKE